MKDDYARLSDTDPERRVLLISYCLRPSQSCPGKMGARGLQCLEQCGEECVVGRLVQRAQSLGYGGICIAGGGRMALRFVAEYKPRAIVAVACEKELAEGGVAVHEMVRNGTAPPAIVAVPLTKDGCVDTEVDEAEAMSVIGIGCGVGQKR